MKFIFVTGGVLSGLGKGVVSASVGLLLKSKGFSVTSIKIDPYVSIDAGTMRPAEHGEVFVTHDGGEIDQDVGHYERFLNQTLSRENNLTTGKVFQSVIDKERHFYYEGRDAEMIPDVVNEIKERIYERSHGFDFAVVEVGGTTGDLENMLFLHAAREIGKENKSCYVMVTYLPFVKNVGELKTKPTQHAVARLREIGIVPDFIVTRNEIPIDQPRVESISKRCFINSENIIDDPDTSCIYEIPLMFDNKRFGDKILKCFGERGRGRKMLTDWSKFVSVYKKPKSRPKVALVGKYVKHGSNEHKDVYISVLEALNHAGVQFGVRPEIVPIEAESLNDKSQKEVGKILGDCRGLIIPQGWGSRGNEGKIRSIQWARENDLPFLGLCYGMQMASLEIARNVLKLRDANSQEIKKTAKNPVIHIMPHQKKYLEKMQYGGTIRLGAWPTILKEGTKLKSLYDKHEDKSAGWLVPRNKKKYKVDSTDRLVFERHRHRYEFNNDYREKFENAGVVFSALSPDGELVEAIELPNHPFFVATQYHPEYISHPLSPHPTFLGFVESLL